MFCLFILVSDLTNPSHLTHYYVLQTHHYQYILTVFVLWRRRVRCARAARRGLCQRQQLPVQLQLVVELRRSVSSPRVRPHTAHTRHLRRQTVEHEAARRHRARFPASVLHAHSTRRLTHSHRAEHTSRTTHTTYFFLV